jgi:hypothetical protein
MKMKMKSEDRVHIYWRVKKIEKSFYSNDFSNDD